jgi:hypothetical protein
VGKSGGEDELVAAFLKAAGEPGVASIHSLTRKIWLEEEVPDQWKVAVVVPIFKKGSANNCKNYRGVSLLSVAGKVLMHILTCRIKPLYVDIGREEQAGFCAGKGCVDQIFCLRQVIERRKQYQKRLVAVFVDFAAAFDSVHRASLWKMLEADGVPGKIIRLFQAVYDGTNSSVKALGGVSRSFLISTGVRQGCVASPALFKIVVDAIMAKVAKPGDGVTVGDGVVVTDLDFADDIVTFDETVQRAERVLQEISDVGEKYGLRINVGKTKVMLWGFDDPVEIRLNGEIVEQTDEFCYLGSTVEVNGSCEQEIVNRLAKAAGVFGRLRKSVWCNNILSRSTKMKIFRSSVMSVLLYSSETWTVLADQLRRLETFHNGCLRAIVGRSLWDKVPSDQTRVECGQQSVDMQLLRKRVSWYGHVVRMGNFRLPKRIYSAQPPGDWKKRRGGQAKTWLQQVLKDMSPLIPWVDAEKLEECAVDRQMWRGMINDRILLPARANVNIVFGH